MDIKKQFRFFTLARLSFILGLVNMILTAVLSMYIFQAQVANQRQQLDEQEPRLDVLISPNYALNDGYKLTFHVLNVGIVSVNGVEITVDGHELRLLKCNLGFPFSDIEPQKDAQGNTWIYKVTEILPDKMLTGVCTFDGGQTFANNLEKSVFEVPSVNCETAYEMLLPRIVVNGTNLPTTRITKSCEADATSIQHLYETAVPGTLTAQP